VQHTNVVSTYDAGVDEGGKFMVMELVNGEDLERRLMRGALDLNRFTELAIQTLEGVASIHDAGLLHLDIKPANIMISRAGEVRNVHKMVDFGRSRPKGDNPKGGGLSGSIYCTSPEYLSEKEVDERADLYSLGCVFYTALSGVRPFEGDNILVIMASHIRHDVRDLSELVPGIPSWLSEWVMSLLALDPEDRPASAEEALDALMQRGTGKRHGSRRKLELAHA